MNILLNYPKVLGLILLIIIGLAFSQINKFELDASADSLVLENDKDLLYYQQIRQQYQSQDSIVITYTPKNNELLSEKQLNHLGQLVAKLKQVDGISSVVSILEAPLFSSPPIPLNQIVSKYIALGEGNADLTLAKKELQTNPFYSNNFISNDGSTTAILVALMGNKKHIEDRNKRNELRLLKQKQLLSASQISELARLEKLVSSNTTIDTQIQKGRVDAISDVVINFSDEADIFIGGLALIVTDIIGYVQNDLWVFSIAVVLVMMLVLLLLFRQIRWTLMPISIGIITALVMTGILGFLEWKVTVISANFFSLLLVMTLSVVVHLMVKYRELAQTFNNDKHQLIAKTTSSMFIPCLFTTLTTMVAFVSLLISNIRPVIDFGYMMSIGVVLALILGFLAFIVIMKILPEARLPKHKTQLGITIKLAKMTDRYRFGIPLLMLAIFALSIVGITKLSVENRFIDYFKKDTQIYQGLSFIDKHLGGTTPLEIIIKDWGYGYWHDPQIRGDVSKIHRYLATLPSVGKVLSIDTPLRLITQINGGKEPSGFFLDIIRQNVPSSIKNQVIKPYLSEENGQIRLVMRIKDTDKELNRNQLISKIRNDLAQQFNLDEKTATITGTMLLYNNMLQSLFQSQIATMGAVFAMIFVMFLLVFRSLTFSLLAIITNILPSFLVLGVMGLLGISLDLMTITIAAIAIGIGVDNAIHYIYRYKLEFKKDEDYLKTMYRAHGSIGIAMFYTALTVAIGFLVLVMSNFIPSIYFGIFTALAMGMALLSNLTLLPRLILWVKPKIS